MTYEVTRKILGLSTLYQRGKTQIPSKVRKRLNLNDGDNIIWIVIEGKIIVERG